jgi:glycerol-3-phosphate dehydrogenase
MKSSETSPSAQVLKTSQPEEFDLVILGGGGTGSTIAAWTFAGEGKQVAVVDIKSSYLHGNVSHGPRSTDP